MLLFKRVRKSTTHTIFKNPINIKRALFVLHKDVFIGRTIQGVMIITGCYSKSVDFYKFFPIKQIVDTSVVS